MNVDVIEQTHHICNRLSELTQGGMWLERRHYGIVKLALQDEPMILHQKWFAEWLKVHQENLVRTLERVYG